MNEYGGTGPITQMASQLPIMINIITWIALVVIAGYLVYRIIKRDKEQPLLPQISTTLLMIPVFLGMQVMVSALTGDEVAFSIAKSIILGCCIFSVTYSAITLCRMAIHKMLKKHAEYAAEEIIKRQDEKETANTSDNG